MIELCYVSSANDRYQASELVELLKVARKNNNEKGITGLLLYDGKGTFIQALEGDETKVKTLFETIRQDKRHKRVNVLGIKNISSRSFSDWQMGFRFINDDLFRSDSIPTPEGFSDFLEADESQRQNIANDAQGFSIKMLEYFRDKATSESETAHNI